MTNRARKNEEVTLGNSPSQIGITATSVTGPSLIVAGPATHAQRMGCLFGSAEPPKCAWPSLVDLVRIPKSSFNSIIMQTTWLERPDGMLDDSGKTGI